MWKKRSPVLKAQIPRTKAMRAGFVILLAICFSSGLASADSSSPDTASAVTTSQMSPPVVEINLNNDGFVWLPNGEFRGPCDKETESVEYFRGDGGAFDLFVSVAGPAGSGRYWQLTIGVGEQQQTKPSRGVCLTTSTSGWRWLEAYKRLPLPWLEDLDNDGNAEFILWSDFSPGPKMMPFASGLMAWVYRLTADGRLTLDLELSRQMAGELAEAYRVELPAAPAHILEIRGACAEILERFADEQSGEFPVNTQ